MTHEEQIAQMIKDYTRGTKQAGKVLMVDPDTKRLEMVDAEDVPAGTLVEISPEDTIVSAPKGVQSDACGGNDLNECTDLAIPSTSGVRQ